MKRFVNIVSIFFIVAGALLLFIPRNNFTKVAPAVSNNYSIYIINSSKQTDYTRYPIYYPPVSVFPGTLKYKILPFYEEYQIRTQQFEPLFFATKRVNELATWGSDLSVASREELLNRYTQLLDEQIAMTEKIYDPSVRNDKYEEIKRHIVQHKMKLQGTNTSQSVKDIYQKYEKRLNIQQNVESEQLSYTLSPIISNKDFGEYTATVDSADVPFDAENFFMQVGNRILVPEYESLNEQSGFFRFPAFAITDQSKKTISLHNPQRTEDVFMEVIPSDEEKQKYFYADMTELLPYGESEVRVNRGNQFAVVTLESHDSSPSALLDAINKNSVTFKKTGDGYEYVMKNYLEKEKRFYLVTEHPSDEIYDQSLPTTISVRYVTPPKLRLQKITNSKQPVTPSQQKDTDYTFSIAIVFLILGIVGLLLPSIKKLKPLRFLLLLVKKHTFVLLGGSIVFMIFEIFLLKRQIDIIDLAIGIIFLMIAYVRKWRSFFFHATFTFLILSCVLFFLHKEIFRITADWMFLMFVFFIIDLIIQRRSE